MPITLVEPHLQIEIPGQFSSALIYRDTMYSHLSNVLDQYMADHSFWIF